MTMKSAYLRAKSMARSEEVGASFFFHAQGSEMQKSILGLYRSVLYQVYPHTPESFPSLTETFERYREDREDGNQDGMWPWLKSEIRRCLFEGFKKACRQFSIVIFVDALDEAGDVQAEEVSKDLEILICSMDDPACQLHVCVSCRHYPEIALGSGTTLVTEKLNGPDIASVFSTRIDGLSVFNDEE